MRFIVGKSSDWNYKETVEINSLEELVDFIRVHGRTIVDKEQVVEGDSLSSELWELEIYDGWRE